jgi:MscS family membrane protein
LDRRTILALVRRLVAGRAGSRTQAAMGLALTIAALAHAVVAAAQPVGAPTAAPPSGAGAEVEAPPAPGSPRTSLAEFLNLAREGRFEEAARYLALPRAERDRGPALAERLKAVLDRHLWVDLDVVSALEEGDRADGLPPDTERIGNLPAPSGGSLPVLLVRREGYAAPWVFSAGTVARIDEWYGSLGDRWLRDRLPAGLLRPGPGELLWWQWLALPVFALACWAVGRVLGWLTLALLRPVAGRTRAGWDDILVARLGGPVTAAWALAAAKVALPTLALYAPAETSVTAVLRAGVLLVVFWALWRCVDAAVDHVRGSAWGSLGSSTRSIVQIGERLGKAALVGLALVAVLAEFGYPVAGLLAGLGIGGIAIALAAQKTVENLFGSLALAADPPFGVGDFVRVEDFVGTVEAIGLRSTKIRTLDRTLVSLPNGRLADMRLESLAARDRMRLACTVGLVYSTSAGQMRQVLEGLEGVLRAHRRIWPDAVVVRFKELGPSSLDIEVMAWFQTSEWSEFQLIRQEVLLQFMDVVERAGTSFAFPTRTVHLVDERPAAGPDA